DETRRLICDIGGGSTELILGRKATPEQLESLHMGCVSMSQQHFANGEITAAQFDAAVEHALVELEPISRAFVNTGWEMAVGASGTINAVNDVLQGLDESDHITPQGLALLRDKLVDAGRVEDLQFSGLADERKAVFTGGVAILCGIFEALQIKDMTTAQSALREGLIYDLLGRQQEDGARNRTVANLIEHYHIDREQGRQVRQSAVALLSQVAMSWELTRAEDLNSIGWAADLHEIGMDVSHSGFHKHGGYLLENMDMPGFSRPEQQLLATLVRCHRRKLQKSIFSDKPISVLRMVVLLRLAVVLNRSRSHDSLPHINAEASKHKLALSFPESWLAEHPLTRVDLQQEAQYLKTVDINLCIKQH
ncbi:MAG: exopolyphosphatase, partial [Pseudomonadota bacterium]